MSNNLKSAVLPGRTIKLHGDGNDPYFCNAEHILAAEAPLQSWARLNLPSDAIIIDAGGNIGLTALILSALVPDGHVHVFEALPSNAAYLRKNIAENNIRNCTVNEVALGNRVGSVLMKVSGPRSHVLQAGRPEAEIDAGAMVPMATLDSYAEEKRMTRVDFIKIDVEGYEPAVLEGASLMIERFSPPIWMEFNTWCLSYTQDFDAREFAFLLWDAFDVQSVDALGVESLAGGGDVHTFFHDNVVLHGTVEDVLLRLRPGAHVPRLDSPIPAQRSNVAHPEIQKLRAELKAMHDSTSWRVTAPLRAMRRRF